MKKIIAISAIALSLFSSTAALPAKPASAAEIYATNGHIPVDIAKSYIGKVRYEFGTRDPQNLVFDCSAFTQFVFKKSGRVIPWGSSAQTSYGTRVPSKSQLSIGDLVMFSTSTPGRINHVGIYIGNGKFISNTRSSGVVISDINTGYWGSRYITGRHY
ncbi:C40 family peptidase [Paenibacillus sedimenti]|uniref:C40 family peptidase n=1 Tax=Paenibacillus sedimenti TaxID=2770274 RepID=A0A926KNJ8_9BACL|nr:C40 family peptidase [Paenibacillus sedimenti]MBD0380403.1 C40 family peptidase [Paenibacillus sedimenti]